MLNTKHANESLVLQVQPARAESTRDLGGLETTMHSLALTPRSPIALEITATATPCPLQSFFLRATTPVALQHLAAQVQARYPQAQITQISAVCADPLQMASLDECSVVELCPGAASYLPLRTFRAQELRNEGVDPLLGTLAAFHHLPAQARAVIQLALLPAPPPAFFSSQADHQVVAQQALAYEQQRFRARQEESALGLGKIVLLFFLVLLLVIVLRFQKRLFPPWLREAGRALVHGTIPALSAGHMALLVGTVIALLTLLFGGSVLFSRLSARFAHPIYDPRLITDKMARPAYRTRLRLFVMTPGEIKPLLSGQVPTHKQVCIVWFHALSTSLTSICRHNGRTLVFLFAFARNPRNPTHNYSMLKDKPWVSVVSTLSAEWRAAWKVWREWREAMRQYDGRARARAVERHDVLCMLVAAYAQYHLASGGSFVPRTLHNQHVARLLTTGRTRICLCTRGWSADLHRSPQYLSVADIAALWHLPQAQDLTNLPHITRRTERTLPAPPIVTISEGYFLGRSTHAGETVPVFLPWSCLRQNMLACASTGKGKSGWMLHLAKALFQARLTGHLQSGLVQIDVHGDLYRETLASLPPELEDAVVLIDLAERARVIGLNPLDVSQGADRDKLVDNIIALIEALWPNAYGPRTENILEYACKTLVEANRTIVARDPVHGPDAQYTLLDVVPLVRAASFRHAVLEQVPDPFLHAWWDQYYEQNDARQQHEYSSSVVTKFSKFASSHVARRILGQPRSTIVFSEIIAQEKILLINGASGEVGTDIASFVGAVLLGLFHVTLAEQARLDPTARRRFLVLIDEFQTLKGVDYQSMLAELRKYGGSFALATQSLSYLDRLDRTLRATVLANIDHLFAFAMSADDAYLLRLEHVEPEDVVNLPNYTCYARLLLNGERLPLFSLHLNDPREPRDPRPARFLDEHETRAEEEKREERCRRIALRSHLRFARPVGEIDALLLSIQAREALMMQPRKKKAPARGGTTDTQATDETQQRPSQRGTRRRGSGKGNTGNTATTGTTEHNRSGRGDEPGERGTQGTQETQVVHELFVAPTQEEEPHV